MVCRLLRSLEAGKLPDEGGELPVDGIVYLSARAGHPVSFPNLFYDLCRLLADDAAKSLDQTYRDPKQSSESAMRALLAAFPTGRTVVLLDNFEDVVDPATQAITERDLADALRTVLEAPPHGVKFLLTTRVAPRSLLRVPTVKPRLRAACSTSLKRSGWRGAISNRASGQRVSTSRWASSTGSSSPSWVLPAIHTGRSRPHCWRRSSPFNSAS